MRHVRCEQCGAGKETGTRMLYPASEIGEPAEYERVIWGVARTPQSDQRWMAINGDRKPLPLDHYNCDGCRRHIKPGERCFCWSIWTADRPEISEWESAYLEAPGSGEKPEAAEAKR